MFFAHRNKVPEIAAGQAGLTLRITGGYTDTGFLGTADGKHFKLRRSLETTVPTLST